MIKKLKNRLEHELEYDEFKEIFNFNIEDDHPTLEENIRILFDLVDEVGNKSSWVNIAELKEAITAYKLDFNDK